MSHQYQFTIINKKTGRADVARVTAHCERVARACVADEYPAYMIKGNPEVFRAHQYAGEIDCSAPNSIYQ